MDVKKLFWYEFENEVSLNDNEEWWFFLIIFFSIFELFCIEILISLSNIFSLSFLPISIFNKYSYLKLWIVLL